MVGQIGGMWVMEHWVRVRRSGRYQGQSSWVVGDGNGFRGEKVGIDDGRDNGLENQREDSTWGGDGHTDEFSIGIS